ncbi:hypothetical protein [Staphylococcus aureus]|uniref:hypothetical protein n=1 Tax=Staphylococcus aureus TaxID=1280 RepID=UPI0035BAF053
MGKMEIDFTLDDYKNKTENIKITRSQLNEYETIFEERKEMVLNSYDGDFIETNFGYLNTDISEEDLEKVKEIEDEIFHGISENVLLKVLPQVIILGKVNRDLKESGSEFGIHLDEHIKYKNGYTEEEIDKLIEPLENKKVYIPKADVSILRKNIINHLALNGIVFGV